MIRLRNIRKEFGSRVVFENVNLTVAPGELVALVGPSGIGKSTLLRLIGGLLPCEGEICIDETILNVSQPEPAASTVLVGQRPGLWQHLTILENVVLVRRLLCRDRKQAATERAMEVLKRFGVDHLAARYPARLSGGEQQRAALARAIAADRKYLLLDEVTSSIDQSQKSAVGAHLKDEIAAGKGAIFATHDVVFAASLAGRTVRLHKEGLTQFG